MSKCELWQPQAILFRGIECASVQSRADPCLKSSKLTPMPTVEKLPRQVQAIALESTRWMITILGAIMYGKVCNYQVQATTSDFVGCFDSFEKLMPICHDIEDSSFAVAFAYIVALVREIRQPWASVVPVGNRRTYQLLKVCRVQRCQSDGLIVPSTPVCMRSRDRVTCEATCPGLIVPPSGRSSIARASSPTMGLSVHNVRDNRAAT